MNYRTQKINNKYSIKVKNFNKIIKTIKKIKIICKLKI